MRTQTKPKTTGAYAPKKEPVFSVNVVEKGVRVEYINSAPPREQVIRRARAD